jgi:hypothetical protein
LLIAARDYDATTFAFVSKHRRPAAMFVLVSAAAAGLTIWLVPGGGSSASATPTGDPVSFLRGVVSGIAANEYERIWPTLHPAQQRVATRDLYVRCEKLSPIPGKLDSIRVVRAVDRRIAIAGVEGGTVESKAVTFEVRLVNAQRSTSVVVTTTHAVAVDGHWRWILTPRRFAIYRSGTCPSAGPGSTS